MSGARQTQTSSRRRPVSCWFCRTRKLRCSRTVPCSNCVSRGVTCDLEQPVAQPSSAPSASENANIIERLHRLENLLEVQREEAQRQVGQHSHAADSPTKLVDPSFPALGYQKVDKNLEVSWLENLHNDQIPSTKTSELFRSQVVFRTCPVGDLAKAQSLVHAQQDELYSATRCEHSRCIWLPPHAEAQILVEKFTRVAQYLPYFACHPSPFSILDQVYTRLNKRGQMPSDSIILLMSIFAAATHFWVQSDCVYGVFSTSAKANGQTSIWIEAAEHVLDITCRSSKASTECIQGIIIIGSVVAHLDGLRRLRMLSTMGIILAQDLGLHRIDHPSNTDKAGTSQAEIGRRIWWHLCATDWMIAARSGGMAEGIYSCHPRQMITRKPLNLNDMDISHGQRPEGRPPSQPTTMSYALQKIRLAEICRGMVDRNPLAMTQTTGLSHDAVMSIDTELQSLINDVPGFYSMTESALMETYGLTRTEAETTVFLGRTLFFLLYSQRCKLHLPYVIRNAKDEAYYLSREICVQNAHLILHSELWQEMSGTNAEIRFKFTDLLTGVFSACLVLLMDLCVNPLSPRYEEQREEVRKSFKLIEAAKNQPGSTAKIVASLISALRKHGSNTRHPVLLRHYQELPADGNFGAGEQLNQESFREDVDLHGFHVPTSSHSGGTALPDASYDLLEGNGDFDTVMEVEGSLNEDIDGLSLYWNDFTQSFEQGLDADSFDWDNIFSELDSSFI